MSTARSRGRGQRPSTAEQERRRVAALRRALLGWGESQGRQFFWREPGLPAFHVLVVEILLSKTRAEVVAPVARVLLDKYPTPDALHRAPLKQLERLLYPLGLHRKRARQLLACARSLVVEHGGEVPDSVEQLMELPAVGRYAANAIASVAFHQRRSVIDANVARVYGRVFSLPPPPDRLSTAHDLWALATRVLPRRRAKEFTWALLDLGGTVCIAREPSCERCPIAQSCDLARTRVDQGTSR